MKPHKFPVLTPCHFYPFALAVLSAFLTISLCLILVQRDCEERQEGSLKLLAWTHAIRGAIKFLLTIVPEIGPPTGRIDKATHTGQGERWHVT